MNKYKNETLSNFAKKQNELYRKMDFLAGTGINTNFNLLNTQRNMLVSTGMFDQLNNFKRITQNPINDYIRKQRKYLLSLTGFKNNDSIHKYLEHSISIRKNMMEKINLIYKSHDDKPTKMTKLEQSNSLVIDGTINKKEKYTFLTLSRLGWAIPYSINMNDPFFNIIADKSDDEINDIMLNTMTENNYERLIFEMDMLIKSIHNDEFDVNNGFEKQVKKIKSCFLYDKESIICFAPTLFTLIEHLNISGKYFLPENDDGKKIINKKFFKNINKNLKNQLTRESVLFSICSKFYNSMNHYSYNIHRDGLNRHMIEHGFLSPDKISIKEFVQLIMICNGFANS